MPVPPTAQSDAPLPSSTTRSILSIWVILHLGLVAASLLTLVDPGETTSGAVEVAMPYLSPLHLRVDQRPLGLAHFNQADWPHRIQWRSIGETEWKDSSSHFQGGHDRHQNHLARTIALAVEQQDTATASMLLVPWINRLLGEAVDSPEPGDAYELRVITMRWDSEQRQIAPELCVRVIVAAAAGASPDQPAQWVMVTTEEDRLNALPAPQASTKTNTDANTNAGPPASSAATPAQPAEDASAYAPHILRNGPQTPANHLPPFIADTPQVADLLDVTGVTS